MNEVVFKTLKEKDFIIKNFLIKVGVELNLTLNDMLLLVYFMNQEVPTLNMQNITSSIYLREEQIMESFNKLIGIKLISMKVEKDSRGVRTEVINLDNIIKYATSDITKKHKVDEKDNIFEKFENEFGRTLSPIEYEIINDWINSGISKELIIQALKESIYNGAKSLRYISKILMSWQEKGYKSKSDLNQGIKNELDNNVLTELFDYNWLDEE